jgi:ankyrin repeat family A protein 2
MSEQVRNLNWFNEHPKSNLDVQITPLSQAAYLGRYKIVQILIENFPQLDLDIATKDNGYTPISAACMGGHFDVMALLAENGADVNRVDLMEQSPLIYCFSRLNEDENYYENKALALKMSEILLAYGADIN